MTKLFNLQGLQNKIKHYYFIDTNVLLNDPNMIDILAYFYGKYLAPGASAIVLTRTMFQELDALKSSDDRAQQALAFNAREASRKIAEIVDHADRDGAGYVLGECYLIIDRETEAGMANRLRSLTPDECILESAKAYKAAYSQQAVVSLVTLDRNFSVLAKNEDIPVDNLNDWVNIGDSLYVHRMPLKDLSRAKSLPIQTIGFLGKDPSGEINIGGNTEDGTLPAILSFKYIEGDTLINGGLIVQQEWPQFLGYTRQYLTGPNQPQPVIRVLDEVGVRIQLPLLETGEGCFKSLVLEVEVVRDKAVLPSLYMASDEMFQHQVELLESRQQKCREQTRAAEERRLVAEEQARMEQARMTNDAKRRRRKGLVIVLAGVVGCCLVLVGLASFLF